MVLNGHDFNLINVTSSVPQGSALRFLRLLILIDLPNYMSLNIRIFADECIRYREIPTPNDQALLQNDLVNVFPISQNKSECRLILLSRKRHFLLAVHFMKRNILKR